MAEDSDTRRPKDKPARLSRGFVRAGGLIEPQMRTAAAKRGFAQARLRALWPEIAGPEFAAICAPLRLARARGPAGGLLTVAVSGAHAPQLQMLVPLLRERVNAALGPGTVGRIQLTHAAHGFAEPPARFDAEARRRRPTSARSPASFQALVMAICATPWRHWRAMCYPVAAPRNYPDMSAMAPTLTRRQTLFAALAAAALPDARARAGERARSPR